MQYAIELFFDKETEEKILKLANRVAEENISTKFLQWKTRPHVTLACFNDVDEKLCIEKLKEFAESHKVVPANLDSVGMFNDTKVVFLNPTMNKSLYNLQSDLHNALKDFDTKGWEWYLPDEWVPHCAIALTSEDGHEAFLKASQLILNEFTKTWGSFASVGLIKITFPVEEIFTVNLSY